MRQLIFISLLVFAARCSPNSSEKSSAADLAGFDPDKDYFEAKVEPEYATHYSVSYHGHYKVVRTTAELSSWESNGTETRGDVMVLVQQGTPVPSLEGDLANASVISIPVERVAINVENGESFVSELGEFDKVVAVGGAISFSDTVRNRVLNKDLGQIGYSWHQPANLEVLLERKADLFFMNIGNLDFADVLDKSRSLGLQTASVFEWAEADYLGRAEWIKYYALFFNAEAKANEIFDAVEKRVNFLKGITADLRNKPTMLWGYYAGKDRWIAHTNSIPAQYMRDAGVINVLQDFNRPIRNGGERVSSEMLLAEANNADHWMIGDIHSSPLPGEVFMNEFSSWRNGQLYHNMKRIKPEANAFDWYARAVVRPDFVLADLIKLIHPELLASHELYFMDHFDKSMKLPLEVYDKLYN